MSAPTYDLGKLHGGLRLDANKAQATGRPIRDVPVPAQVVLPITQHAGEPADPIVSIGERVLSGQLIAEAFGAMGVPVHASTSGTVVAIEPWPVSRRYGEKAPCVVIESDGEDEAYRHADRPLEFKAMPARSLRAALLEGGIVGLGGAVFPTAQKLSQASAQGAEFLILNGVECEPYISCDDALMRDAAASIVSGAEILLRALEIERCYIAVESDKPEALQQLGAALDGRPDDSITLKQVPTIYPSGGEDQLVQRDYDWRLNSQAYRQRPSP